MTVSCDSINQ